MRMGTWSYGAATCEVVECLALPAHMRAVTREVKSVHTDIEHQHRGDASELLKQVCAAADAERITLVLWPQPYGDDIALSRCQLASWYERRFGFQEIQSEPLMMARMPLFHVEQLRPSTRVPKKLTRLALVCSEQFDA